MAVDRNSTGGYDDRNDTPFGQSSRPHGGPPSSVPRAGPSTEPTRSTSTASRTSKADLPLRFIDEFQRQKSKDVRREIRAHVRKDTHLKQKRLNDASKPKLLSAGRRLIQKKKSGNDSPQSVESSSGSEQSSIAPAGASSSVAESVHYLAGDMVQIHGTGPRLQTNNDGTSDFPLFRLQFNSTTPYALLLDDNAPILQLDPRAWPFPQAIRGNGPAISVWMPGKSIPIPDARSLRPCLLKSAQVVPWITQSVDYLVFKNEVIQWVNKRLVDPEHATSDMTIGVLICLMSWEITRANIQELGLHIDGLSRIMELRGGPSNITTVNHFCWKIALIDLLVALLTNTEPRLSFQQQERVLLAPAINQSLGRIQMPDSPLFGTEPFACILAGSAFCNDAIILLQSMQDLTSGKWRGDSPPTINTTEPIPADPSNSLSRMICAASSIYFRAFKDPPVAFASRSHSNALATIAACLEDTRNDATWTEYPGILLWVVLTALAAAVHHPQCSFFAMFVFRVGTSAAWWGPREARAAICTFLQVKKRSEDVGR